MPSLREMETGSRTRTLFTMLKMAKPWWCLPPHLREDGGQKQRGREQDSPLNGRVCGGERVENVERFPKRK